MYRFILKPLLFLLPAETAHYFTLNCLKFLLFFPLIKPLVRHLFSVQDQRLEKKVFGLHFPNPVGLAAGFDKNAKYMHELACLGFGFIEVGTVTPKPQAGNPKPRLFRLPKDNAIINRMGFNNDGLEVVVQRLKKRPKDLVVGGNIGKNKVTPNEQALDDYLTCFNALFDHVDYFVVNVSSPNTPGLRELQDKAPLSRILSALQEKNLQHAHPKPILLKIAPDLTNSQLDDIIDIVQTTGIAGLIATNTTISREGLKTSNTEVEAMGAGGLSGQPLTQHATTILQYLSDHSKGSFPIIGVGGIQSAENAKAKLAAGAALVQVYSGFIFAGPGLVKQINRGLL